MIAKRHFEFFKIKLKVKLLCLSLIFLNLDLNSTTSASYPVMNILMTSIQSFLHFFKR